jgi:PAS domain S-box-containing protein
MKALARNILRPDERLATVIDGLVDGFYALDSGWRFTLLNRCAEAHFRIKREQVLGRSIWEVFPQGRSEFEQRFRAVVQTGIATEFITRSVAAPDTFVKLRLFPLDGGLGVSAQNISEARATEAALRDGHMRYEVAANAAGLGVWDWDVATGHMLYSDAARGIHGFPAEGLITLEQVRAATHRADLPRTWALAQRALDPTVRDTSPYEYRIVRPSDGQTRWVRAHGGAVFETGVDGSERAIRYIGTIQDITDQKLAEQAVRDSEARLRVALEAGRMAVWDYDVATETVAPSPELNAALGFPPATTPTATELRAGYHRGERERLQQIGREAYERGERFFEAEFQYTRPDGSDRWFLLRAEIKLNSFNIPTTVLGVLVDITERRAAEERQQLLINELNHRVKNTLATVQSIAAQTMRLAATTEEAQTSFESRLIALSRAHDVLTRETWDGASLYEIVAQAVEPYSNRGEDRLHISGPYVRLLPRTALAFAMALQELATNAAKYGALSNEVGQVSIVWSVLPGAPPTLHVRWEEKAGPTVQPPTRRGFGSRLIERSLARDLDGNVAIEFAPGGVLCTIDAPLV